MTSALHEPHAYWSTLVEGFQASPQECYAAIEEAIQRREIPGVRTSRVVFKEGGFLSAKRIYLRVSRKRLGFDICAAPFGTGFFFSWRLGKLPPSNVFGCLALLLSGCAVGYVLFLLNEFRRPAETPLGFSEMLALGLLLFFTLWVVGKAVRKGYLSSEDAFLNMPLIGSLYDRFFRPSIYYKLDTMDIFQKAVHAAILEVVNDATRMRGKGLRALAPASPSVGKAVMLGRRRSSSPGTKLPPQTSSSKALLPSTPGPANPLIWNALDQSEAPASRPARGAGLDS